MSSAFSSLKVAIVHDWLVVHAGAENVLDELLAVFPQADLFALIAAMPGEPPRHYHGRPVRTSFIQQLPFGVSRYRNFLPLFPSAVERHDLRTYDLVVSSSYCVAKGAKTRDDQLHVSYCYTPVRYAWDLREQYLDESGLSGLSRRAAHVVLNRLKSWDRRTSDRVDHFLTLSHHIEDRIRRCYGRESTVVHPPVDLEKFTPPATDAPRRGFVTASRLVPYKLTPMLVRAFAAMPDAPLTVIGDGPDLDACRREARGHAHIRILGHQPHDVLRTELQKAEAFVFAALEDFGIAPLEAQACGTPVIAFGQGGVRETIREGETGRFFTEQTSAAVQAAVRAFRAAPPLSASACRANAERFSKAKFRREIASTVERLWGEHEAKHPNRRARALEPTPRSTQAP